MGFRNYGGILQNYAMEVILSRYGVVDTLFNNDTELIDVRYHISWDLRRCFKLGIYKYFSNQKYLYEIVRVTRCRDFCNRNINIRYNVNFSDVDNEYDFFVVGSDQVWNLGVSRWWRRLKKKHVSDIKFLKFASPNKRIAYAASIAQPDIPPALRDSFIESVNAMKAVTVREVEGAELIQKYTGRKVEVVLDPTMLLSANDWIKLERKPIWLNEVEKYLFTYFLGKRVDKVIEKVAIENNLKIINMLDFNNFDHYTTSPEEWIYLIHHAELVYTDSFHGTVFSILFKKPFVVCDRIESGIYSKMTSRIDTLLEKFGLENRRGTKENGYMIANPVSIQYGGVDDVLTVDRKKADEYLRRAFNLDQN